AAMEGIGYTIATDLEIWPGHPGKVLGVREDWANAYPNTHIALVKALLEACRYCADPANHEEIRQLLSQRAYLSTSVNYIHLGDPNHLACQLDMPMREYAHHQFFLGAGNRPSRTEHLWMMTQLARWGEVPFPRNWVEIVERVCRVGVFSTAARELGIDVSYERAPIQLFDGVSFGSQDPLGYLQELTIKHDVYVAEVALPSRR
ncbi:MAG: ABC transporter substrate-binding protein, partial [Thermostichales cyanobacterium DRC_bins_46]